jgi:hypothetical protein
MAWRQASSGKSFHKYKNLKSNIEGDLLWQLLPPQLKNFEKKPAFL